MAAVLLLLPCMCDFVLFIRRFSAGSLLAAISDGIEYGFGSLRGEVPVLEETLGDVRRTLGMVRSLAERVGLVEPDVVQKGGDAQDLPVVVDALRPRQLLGERVHPQAVGVAPDGVGPHPGDERLDLLRQRLHGSASVAEGGLAATVCRSPLG